MKETLSKTLQNKDLKKYGLEDITAHWNLDGETLQKLTVEKGMGTETENGTLCIHTGKFTGRSPKDRFLVKDDYTKGQKSGGEGSTNLWTPTISTGSIPK